MRVIIYFSKNAEVIPDKRSAVNSYIMKCLGKNNKYHGTQKNYSISHLIDTSPKVFFTVSSLDIEFIDMIISGIMKNKNFGYGMALEDIRPVEEKFYNGINHFATLSPFIIKKSTGNKKYNFLTLKDTPNFALEVEKHLRTKLLAIDKTLDLNNFKVSIKNNPAHYTKDILFKNVKNTANKCQFDVYTNKKVAELLYNVGIGQSTGCGFGTICKTENQNLYK